MKSLSDTLKHSIQLPVVAKTMQFLFDSSNMVFSKMSKLFPFGSMANLI